MTKPILTKLINRQQALREAVMFDATDNKGRQFGARFSVDQEEYALEDPAATSGWYAPVGISFVLNIHATRGGKDYGASQSRRRFSTLEEAAAQGRSYFARAEKGALKNKARVA